MLRGSTTRKEVNMQIIRSVVVASMLSPLLLPPFSAIAQEKSHLTSEQVTHAIQEVEKLAQKKIQENAVPGGGRRSRVSGQGRVCERIWCPRCEHKDAG
jgi:hypothetical protein